MGDCLDRAGWPGQGRGRAAAGGGQPEVNAAHIRPVAHQGSDSVRNGLAMSGTLHWMVDRGPISVADDHRVLVSRNRVPRIVVDRLIVPSGKLCPPQDPRTPPHPASLQWHRETVFGQGMVAGPQPWKA